MRLLRLSPAICTVALLVAGCPKSLESSADAGLTAGALPDAGSSTGLASFTLRYGLPDAGMERIPLIDDENEARPLIEPTSTLELHSTSPLRNYRVRLFDEAERAMVSDDVAEESKDGLRYRISPPTPLKSGHKYTLVLDAQTDTSMLDAQGRELDDVRFPFQVAGEKEKSQPPAPPAKKRQR